MLYNQVTYIYVTAKCQHSEGNVFLRGGDVDLAIECYDKALELGDREQEGVLLVMRGSALLQRAYACRYGSTCIICLFAGALSSSVTADNSLSSLTSSAICVKFSSSQNAQQRHQYLGRGGAPFY
jgi:hypothetical protein